MDWVCLFLLLEIQLPVPQSNRKNQINFHRDFITSVLAWERHLHPAVSKWVHFAGFFYVIRTNCLEMSHRVSRVSREMSSSLKCKSVTHLAERTPAHQQARFPCRYQAREGAWGILPNRLPQSTHTHAWHLQIQDTAGVYISSVKTVTFSGWSWSASLQLLSRLKHWRF